MSTAADQLLELNCHLLDLYTEQRLLYRELVAAGQHRAVPVPAPPEYKSLPKPIRRPNAGRQDTHKPALVRTYPAELAVEKGRTIEARLAPFGVKTNVADPPRYEPYVEEFAPGAFAGQVGTKAARVWLNFEHQQGLRGIVGHSLRLHEKPDGLHGTFHVHPNSDGDKALQLVREGVLGGISLEFKPLRSRVVDGIVQRLRVHVDAASLCRFPAYQAAQVLAVRAGL
jgi:HK97 family phage prohead protease